MTMSEKKVGIVAECGCDLPKSMLYEYDIEIVYFLIETESGVFMDTEEITADNIVDYMSGGRRKSISTPPSPEVYRKAFEKNLKKYDEVIHIAISSGISESINNSRKAVEEMGEAGKRIHIFDTGHLSSGMGFFVLKAGELAGFGFNADRIIEELTKLRSRVSTSFIARNADFLAMKGLVSDNVKKFCDLFNVHPVLAMKNGKLKLRSIQLGDYEASMNRYVRSILRDRGSIDSSRCFITHVGCSVKQVNMIKQEVMKCCEFSELSVTKASATISSNCGPGTFGVLFVRK